MKSYVAPSQSSHATSKDQMPMGNFDSRVQSSRLNKGEDAKARTNSRKKGKGNPGKMKY